MVKRYHISPIFHIQIEISLSQLEVFFPLPDMKNYSQYENSSPQYCRTFVLILRIINPIHLKLYFQNVSTKTDYALSSSVSRFEIPLSWNLCVSQAPKHVIYQRYDVPRRALFKGKGRYDLDLKVSYQLSLVNLRETQLLEVGFKAEWFPSDRDHSHYITGLGCFLFFLRTVLFLY